MKMPKNTAAYITANKARPLRVKAAPYTSPGPDQVVIRNYAVAINPIDWILQTLGTTLSFGWIKYPFILGSDVAGEVVEIGPQVTRFQVGDRVVGLAAGQDSKRNTPVEGGFQHYVVLLEHMTAPIPDSLSYEQAAVLPLGLATAACGLFQSDQLNLDLPTSSSSAATATPKPSNGKTVLLWGGSTSVGSNAIQLAVAAGYEVFATASPKNFAYVEGLGASRVFDYKSETVVRDIVRALEQGRTTAGALVMGASGADACMDIMSQCACPGRKFVSLASYPTPSPIPERFPILKTILAFLSWNIVYMYKSRTRGVKFNLIFGTTLIHNGVGKAVFGGFLGPALAEARFRAAPEAVVVGKGLEAIQDAMDYQKGGMSAKKVVVSLAD
ncbi:zinc-binding oxidoreductase CipB [Xylariomycetidae sp. FL2044]|nr:zinc-binding oxidoreductase CipB [Xylariomycetidae sp. FL2044]